MGIWGSMSKGWKKMTHGNRKNNETQQRLTLSWLVVYDIDRASFLLKTIKQRSIRCKYNPYAIRKLLIEDIVRFGFRDEANENNKRTLLCVKCGVWLNGICARHPLIFVLEKKPPYSQYLAVETLPPFLSLRNSTIEGAGKGIFTELPLPSGLAFGPYGGFHSSDPLKVHARYAWQVANLEGKPSWVDAEYMLHSNWMRYVNCPRSILEQNMVGILYAGQIYYCTFRAIGAGEELFVWYGSEYGETLQIPNSKECGGPLAPKNYHLFDKDGNYIANSIPIGYLDEVDPVACNSHSV